MAVAATIGYSLDMLDATDRDRFYQLGIFAEDAEVPLPLITALWQATARVKMSEAETAALYERLDGLSLVSLAWADENKVMVVHDVIRDFARNTLGPERVTEPTACCLDRCRGKLARRYTTRRRGWRADGGLVEARHRR